MKVDLILRQCKLSAAVLIGSIAMVTVSVNASTLNLKPTEKADKYQLQSTGSENTNAYAALLGLESASAKDMLISGSEVLAQYRKSFRAKSLEDLPGDWMSVIHDNQGIDKKWLEQTTQCNARKGASCFDAFKSMNHLALMDTERLQILSSRYYQILEMPDYHEVSWVSDKMPWPNFGYFDKLGMEIKSHLYQAGKTNDLVALVARESEFWRMVLSKSESLISKMVAISNLWKNIQLVSDLHGSGEFKAEDSSLFRGLITPLSADSLDISEAFAYELKFTMGALEQNIGLELLPAQQFEVISSLQKYFVAPLQCLSKLSADNFKLFYTQRHITPAPSTCGIRDAFDNAETAALDLHYATGDNTGLSHSVISATDYIARVHDLNGMLELLGYQLSSPKNAGKKLNPNQAGQNGMLSFKCLSPGSVCRLPL